MGCVLEPTATAGGDARARGVSGPAAAAMTGDEFVARVADLPLAFEPGEGWLYDTPIDLLGVLLVRATQAPLSALIAERITGPLGMSVDRVSRGGRTGLRPPTCRAATASRCSTRRTASSPRRPRSRS